MTAKKSILLFVGLIFFPQFRALNYYLQKNKCIPQSRELIQKDPPPSFDENKKTKAVRKNTLENNRFDHRLSVAQQNEPMKTKKGKPVRVLCWILTSPTNLPTKGKAVKETWGKRCDILLFMSSKEDKTFPAVGLNVNEGRENLWYKTRAAWQYVIDHHLEDADWFLKADDDTYCIVENLKHLCSKYETEKPYYFGRHFIGGYNSGGAGYVFSKETLRRFGKVLQDHNRCPPGQFDEDVYVGNCLRAEFITPHDCRDSKQRETFHPFPPWQHLTPGALPKWYPIKIYTKSKMELQTAAPITRSRSIIFNHI